MKRWLLVLGMITCILGVSACGSKQEEEPAWTEMTEEEAIYYGEQIFQNLREICSGNYENEKAQIAKADAVSASAFSSWDSAQEDIGEFVEILEENAQINDDGFIVNLKIKGTVHDANIEIIFDDVYKRSLFFWGIDGKGGNEYAAWYGDRICGAYPNQPDNFMLYLYP